MPKMTLTCPECGLRFVAAHHRQQFCTPAHQRAYNNRQLTEGQRMIAIAKAWRAGRHATTPELKASAKEAFAMLRRELDALNAADAAAGRMPALRLFRRRQVAGLLDNTGALAS